MRTWLIVAALGTAACSSEAPVAQPISYCSARSFEGSTFTLCSAKGGKVEVRNGFRSFAQLQSELGVRADNAAFAMNAGMFDEAGEPIGLAIEDGREVRALNRKEGGGNFHLMPNGVFLVRTNGRTEVVRSRQFKAAENIAYASQSGPMLVIDGKLHPKFDDDGDSRFIRNGVGIGPDGTALFVISDDAVSFGKFARFFRDALKSKNALYFDGSVSSLWDPVNGRMDSFSELGPMVLVFKPAASAPDREGRAKP
jgi:uncharacterized protein YigE (DUF2233 family)